jgi:hypothetical protein
VTVSEAVIVPGLAQRKPPEISGTLALMAIVGLVPPLSVIP